jgi:hypothetical protein
MERTLHSLIPLLLVGCAARTIALEVPAAPAVALNTQTVAVVAQDRACRPVADALIDEITHHSDFTVNPHSDVRLVVFGCGVDVGWTLHQEVDASTENTQTNQSADLVGRGHAAIAVSAAGQPLAHLVGSARDRHLGTGVTEMFRTRRAMQQRLTLSLADDLVVQLNPLPIQLERRVYPNAGDGSARQLHSLAVLAEQRGHLDEAHRLASDAMDERPSNRAASYLVSLERRLRIQPSTD